MQRVYEDIQLKMEIKSKSRSMPRINFQPNKVSDDLRKKHTGIFVSMQCYDSSKLIVIIIR